MKKVRTKIVRKLHGRNKNTKKYKVSHARPEELSLIRIFLPPQFICLEHETVPIELSVFYEKLRACGRAMFTPQK